MGIMGWGLAVAIETGIRAVAGDGRGYDVTGFTYVTSHYAAGGKTRKCVRCVKCVFTLQ